MNSQKTSIKIEDFRNLWKAGGKFLAINVLQKITTMVDFSYRIINQIKEATDDSHVRTIIVNSIRDLHTKNINGFSGRRKYMMNMVMALRYIKAEGLSPKALVNVDSAIEIIERLRKQEYSNLF
jgi:hypothetical protein